MSSEYVVSSTQRRFRDPLLAPAQTPPIEALLAPAQARPSFWSCMAPDRRRRLEILRTRTRSLQVASELDLEGLAESTVGFLAGDLRRLVSQADRMRIQRNGVEINAEDFAVAHELLELRAGGRLVLSERDRAELAYYQAGQAIVGMVQPGADVVHQVSLFESERRHEPVSQPGGGDAKLRGEASRRGRIIGLLAGGAAMRLVYGTDIEQSNSDHEQARAIARAHIAKSQSPGADRALAIVPSIEADGLAYFHGRPDRSRWHEPHHEFELNRVLRECEERAFLTLRQNRRALDLLALELVTYETIDLVHGRDRATPSGTLTRRLDETRRATSVPGALSLVEAYEPEAEEGCDDQVRHQRAAVMSSAERMRYFGLGMMWAIVSVSFWAWWLQAGASSSSVLYWVQTTMLFYQVTLLPTVYWAFVGRMKKPRELEARRGAKVALITLCVPTHEALSVIARQLEALQKVDYPHDSWILDEGNSPEVRALAEESGVRYFSRKGVAAWNDSDPPFQRATKAGNVNAWLDHVASLGLDYDIFVQFDIDHRPRSDYLDRTLGYFRDPGVAWVQAPSVCGNTDNWAARGLTEQDLIFHGPLQMGFYGQSQTPFIIGSHTSYRTAAIRNIGGFQPTRAEDHLDTVVLAANGHRGVFVPELIALGDGPEDLATYLGQQFAWAYSMIQILVRHTPHLIRRYSFKQAFQFLFCQSWYMMWSISLALLWALPTIALVAHRQIASVPLGQFAIYFTPVILASSLMWTETRKWFQPHGVRLSWRGIILGIARWPIVLWAGINVMLRIKRPYMITPKGVSDGGAASFGLYGPGLALAAVPLAAILECYVTGAASSVWGYYLLALANAILGLILVITTVTLEIRSISEHVGIGAAVRARGGVVSCASLLMIWFGASVALVWAPILRVIS